MKKTGLIKFCSWWLPVLLLSPLLKAADADTDPTLTVYAAASLTNALDQIGTDYTKESGVKIKFSYGASSTLARQIEAGASTDVFFSADNDWMDYLQQRNLIDKSSRKPLLGNRLVLIAPANSNAQIKIAQGFALSTLLGKERLAVADPDSVPAGKYAKAALTKLGVWDSVSDKLVRADNVRTALTFVDRAEAPLGIVYETDAIADSKVRIVDRFPADSHSPIIYPVALTHSAPETAKTFIAFLNSITAQTIFKRYGFTVPQQQ